MILLAVVQGSLKTNPVVVCVMRVSSHLIPPFIIIIFREKKYTRFLLRRARLDGQAAQNIAPLVPSDERQDLPQRINTAKHPHALPVSPLPSFSHAAFSQRFDATSNHSFTQSSDCTFKSLPHAYYTNLHTLSRRVHCLPQSSFLFCFYLQLFMGGGEGAPYG